MHRSNALCLYLNSEHDFDSCSSRHVMHMKCSVLVLSICGSNIVYNNLRYWKKLGAEKQLMWNKPFELT